MMDDLTSGSAALPWGFLGVPFIVLYCSLCICCHLVLVLESIVFHLYANACQVYFPFKHSGSLQPLLDYLNDIRGWMALNFLNFNEKKAEVMLFNSSASSCIPAFDLSSLAPREKSRITNLVVKMESSLKPDWHVNAVVKSSIFQLRRL